MKICLTCGDKLLDAAQKCPTCGQKEFETVDRDDVERIAELQAAAKVDKDSLTPTWKKPTSLTSYLTSDKFLNERRRRERVEENKRNDVAGCPKCGSTAITAQRKGFGFGKAAVGTALLGEEGWLAGGIGAKKMIAVCLNCGHKWKL